MNSKEAEMNETLHAGDDILPRLMASNALRANLDKHMTLSQMADQKASMIMTAASLIMTISVTQFEKLGLQLFLLLVIPAGLAILFSIFAIIPALHVKGGVNLFYFRSFARVSEEDYLLSFKKTLADKDELYDAYLREIYYLGKHRLTHKYRWISYGLWALMFGLLGAALLTMLKFY